MRISIDTREDSYEDALGVLRRAYGRHRLARKPEGSPAVAEASDLGAGDGVAEESGNQSGSGAGRGSAGSREPSGQGAKKSAAKRTPARRRAAESPVSKAEVEPAAGEEAALLAPDHGRSGAPRKRSASRGAANVAPRGQSEAIRAWAHEQGMQVSSRGRIPAKAIAAYLEAHNV
jgi:hypothetical protein